MAQPDDEREDDPEVDEPEAERAAPTSLPARGTSIRGKFYLALTVLTGGTLIFVAVYYPSRLAWEVDQRVEAEAAATATLLASHLAFAVDRGDRRAAARGIAVVKRLRDVAYVGVFGRNGNELAARGEPSGSASMADPQDAVRRSSSRVLVSRRVFGAAGQAIGAVVIESSLGRLHARRRHERMITAVFGFTLLAVALLIAVLLDRHVVQPIKRVTHAVKRVAREAWDAPAVPVESRDEAGQLALAFNAMRERLQRTAVSRDHLDNILGSVADMLFVLDSKGTVRAVNRVARAALGLREDQIVGRKFASLVLEDVRPLFAAVNQWGQVRDRTVTLAGTRGTRVPATVNGAMLRGPKSTRGGMVLLARDMTEMRRLIAAETQADAQHRRAKELAQAYADLEEAHRQLKEAQAKLVQTGKLAAVGELAAGVAHEMNNPLSAVLTYALLLDRKMGKLREETRAELKDFGRQLSLIRAGAERCKAISDNLLAFSRASNAPMDFVRLTEVVDRTFELIGAHLRFKRINVAHEVAEDLVVWGSVGELQQVVTNLAMNAAQAVGEGDTVKVVAMREGDDVVALEVHDDGPGMPPEVQERIFEPFFTTKPLGEGTGLGLSIVHGIVKKHRGQITVESTPDKGTTFRVTLPTIPPDEDAPEGRRSTEVSLMP